MGVARCQKVSANEIFIYSREESGEKKLGSASEQRPTTPKSSSHQDTRQSETRAIQRVSVWQVESQSVRGKLPFLRWLALSNANRAGRITFANCFLDC
jgi:hypothetical protein